MDLADYAILAVPLVAPCAGTVIAAEGDSADFDVPESDQVAPGDRQGEVGNPGVSTDPDLHIHAQRPAADGAPPLSGDPLALRIDGRFLVWGDRLWGLSE
jgi:hypothetical protein